MTVMVGLGVWAAGAALAGDPCADPAAVTARSEAIQALYDAGEEDRADRSAAAKTVLARDEARVKEVRSLDKKGQLCTAADKWHAAWIMTQGDAPDVIERAHTLAQEAMEAHHENGAWLVAYTFDLKQTFAGQMQSFGTQTRLNERNQWCLVTVDPEFTDARRAEYGQPPLAEVYRRVLDANGFQDDAATFERIDRRGLACPPLGGTRKAQRSTPPS